MGIADSITLGEVLGEGASAVTYKATDANGRTVCVKQYKSSVQSADKGRIKREIDVLKRLNHPQVPTVFGAYIQQVNGRDLLHVVQEFVDGQDLQVWLKSNTLSMSETRQILADTLGVLEHLHSATPPILHRDIKPSNLMRRLDGRIVLIDFGQAVQDVHRTLGQTMVTGTIGYQAPEQISGNATVKSDVYSVGVVAVELLTGTSAFAMLEGQILRWEKHCRRLPLSVQEWLDGVLHPEPRQRWDAAEALQQLQQLGDVFVESSVGAAHVPSNVRSASTDFLNMLDGAIQDESERQRLYREAEYRQKVEAERIAEQRRQQEAAWEQTETQLWKEMIGSWEQLLSAIQAKKVSQYRGLEIFRRAFEPRIQQCFDSRQSGKVDARLVMLIEYASNNPSKMRIQKYDEWVFKVFLKDKEVDRKQISLKRVHQQRELAMVKQELNMQSWWSALWKKSALEQSQTELETEIASLEQQIDALWEDIQQTMLRYLLHNRNEKITNFKSRHEQTLKLQSIDSFHMVPIDAGTFMMGASDRYAQADDRERPRHKVTLTQDFLMGKYPVTQELWESVMGSNPSKFKGVKRPVERISWFSAIEFCNKLSELEGFQPVYIVNARHVVCNWKAKGYRLPTEAEWEYAARAVQTYIYAGGNNVDKVAWYNDNSGGETHPVCQKHPNHLGLYDMSGNVWEWVWDWYGDYSSLPTVDPQGPTSGSSRVLRGGSWIDFAQFVRVSTRGYNDPTYRRNSLGLRLCRTQ
jgi:formylglycine-generating enzyme required for sulfatase activity/serine/threonine protein kinase